MTTHVRAPAPAGSDRSSLSGRAWLIQRKCACGGTTDASGECEACRKKREHAVQRSALRSPPSAVVPASVHDVLRESGQPLDRETRAFFEPRLGHDFSRVRVHTNSAASASAAAIDAQAYTVGRDVVFGAGNYGPRSREGRRLLAHELAHVVQQARGGSRVQAASIATAPEMRIAPEDDDLEREAESVADEVTSGGFATPPGSSGRAIQRAPRRPPAIVGLDPSGPEADLTGKTDDALLACMRDARADPEECKPSRALTWAAFAGPPRRSRFSAETFSDVKDKPMDPVKAGCLQRILGKSKDETRVFQAALDGRKSWGRAVFRDPTNTALTGCRRGVATCTTFFAREARAGRSGGTFASEGTPSADCAASAIAGKVTATSAGDCANIETECTRTAVAESQRLLAHEQGHFNISCVIAGKANSALIAGGDLAGIKTAVAERLRDTQASYDGETEHGCNAGAQATWESDITNKLPKVSVP